MWGWISPCTTEAMSSFPHSGASEIRSSRECPAELLGKNRQQWPQRWADLYWKVFWLLNALCHFSLFYVHCKEAKSFSHPEICVLLLYPGKKQDKQERKFP